MKKGVDLIAKSCTLFPKKVYSFFVCKEQEEAYPSKKKRNTESIAFNTSFQPDPIRTG